jgi:hypothetical protein
MGAVNWLAVVLAAAVGVLIGALRTGRPSQGGRQIVPGKAELAGNYVTAIIVFLIGATMLGHSFARIGSETLSVKPWLYFMQSGGVALAFVVPAVWITHVHNRVEPLRRVIDCLFWIVSYLGMGIVFWALG